MAVASSESPPQCIEPNQDVVADIFHFGVKERETDGTCRPMTNLDFGKRSSAIMPSTNEHGAPINVTVCSSK